MMYLKFETCSKSISVIKCDMNNLRFPPLSRWEVHPSGLLCNDWW